MANEAIKDTGRDTGRDEILSETGTLVSQNARCEHREAVNVPIIPVVTTPCFFSSTDVNDRRNLLRVDHRPLPSARS